jgi:outer membrane receptor protein involved in Fe transport
MNPFEAISGMAKISYRPMNNLNAAYSLIVDRSENKNYSHAYKYTPDYTRNLYSLSFNHLVVLTHTLSASTFHELKVSYETYSREEHASSNPFDPIYDLGIHPLAQSSLENVFTVGGVDPRFLDRKSSIAAVKYEITSQLNRYNMIKAGAEYRMIDLREETYTVVKNEQSKWQLTIPDISSSTHNYYHKRPIEAAAYIQNKIEIEDLIVNAGIRFDYFNSRSKVPVSMIDPHNDDTLSHAKVDENAAYRDASAKMQVSPRLGLAFPISDNGNIHASYGHFFQMPEYQRLYENPEFEVSGRFQSYLGNADLDAQRTVTYEIGLQQRIAQNLVLDATCFYKDIRNLAGSTLYQTFDLDQYGQYSNKDYGNAWGITLSLDVLKTGLFSASVDYTYQVAEGNGSDPRQAFLDAQNRDESTKSLIPLNWDQRNVLNAIFSVEGETWGIKSISHYATGTPYDPVTTFDQQRNIQLMNQGRRRAEFNMDLNLYQHLSLYGIKPTFFLSIYNVFDSQRIDLRPELSSVDLASHETRAVLNSLYEYRFNPASQPRPRLIRIGVEIGI